MDNNVVTIFADGNFTGNQQSLAIGRYRASDLTIGNKALTALKVPAGLRATLFTDDNFQGQMKIITSDMAGVGDDWNDKTASIIIDQPTDPALLLYLAMDDGQIDGSNIRLSLPTALAEGDTATAHSGVSLVADDRFGSCLYFDGSAQAFVELPAMTSDYHNGLTVAAWVSYEAFNSWSRIVDLGLGPSNSNILLANLETGPKLTAHLYKGNNDSSLTSSADALELNQWHYLAFTVDGSGRATLYVDGKPLPVATTAALNPPETVRRTQQFIGKSNWGQDGYFKGKMAQLRLFNRPLTANELQSQMAADGLDLPAFRLSHPIAFSLLDDDLHYALYIAENPQSHALNLTLDNTTAQTITLSSPNQVAAANNFHFELRFHGGVLSAATLQRWATPPKLSDWDIFVRADNLAVSFFLLHKTKTSLAANEQLRLSLPTMTAAAGAGARGTQVELRPNPAQLSYTNNPTTRISGSRTQFLQIVSQTGRQSVALHAAFVGSDRILNDGHSPNQLWLRLKNFSPADPTHGLSGEIGLNPAGTRFILSLDVADQDGQAWGVANKSQVQGMHLYLKSAGQSPEQACAAKQTANNDWQITAPNNLAQAADLQWVITPQPSKKSLAAGESLDVVVCDLASSLPSGNANFYVSHENIPGYWDGQLVCPIEKTPLLFGDVYKDGAFQQRGNVGIGVANPRIQLALGDDDTGLQQQGDGELAIYTNNTERMRVSSAGRVGIGVTNPAIQLALGDNDTGLQGQGDGELAIYTNSTERVRVSSSGRVGIGVTNPAIQLALGDNDTGLQQQGDGELAIYTNNTERVRVSSAGRVGIGVTNPAIQLALGDNDTGLQGQGDGELAIYTNNTERMRLSSSGRVGIGVVGPAARLHVVQTEADVNSAIFYGGRGVYIGGIKGTRTGLIIDTESEWGGLGINNTGTGRTIDINATNTNNTNAAININFHGKGPSIVTNSIIQAAALTIGNITIGEKELNILQQLANSQLKVAIACNANGYLIDNYAGGKNGGDGDRTIQFRDNTAIDNNTTMRLQIA